MGGADQAGSAINTALDRAPDGGERAGDWRRHLKNMRTLPLFAATYADPRKLGEAIDRLKPSVLQAAAVNPDHSEQGRAAIVGGMKGRGIVLEPWRMRVPGFLSAGDLDRGNGLFFGVASFARRWLVVVMVLGVIAFVALVLNQVQYHSIGAGVAGDPRVTHWNIRVDPNAINALLIAFLAFVTWFGLVLFRRKPARIAILRTSRVRSVSGATKKMLRTEISPYGDRIGLSEQDGDRVRSAGGYIALGQSLRNRTGLNLANGFARGETLRIKPAQNWRPLTTSLLLDSADAILIDISDPQQSDWKLDLARGIAPRCVFVSLWGKGEAAAEALHSAGFSNPCHFYAPDGHMVDRAKFRAAMLGAMRATLS